MVSKGLRHAGQAIWSRLRLVGLVTGQTEAVEHEFGQRTGVPWHHEREGGSDADAGPTREGEKGSTRSSR